MNTYKEVRQERTGWRDDIFDNVLKDNGMDPPDSFFVTEYNYGKSVAMIEYKRASIKLEKELPTIERCHESLSSGDSRIINYCSMRKNKELYFVVLYDYERKYDKENKTSMYHITGFIVYPSNPEAISQFGKDPIPMTEPQYISFLYRIRNNTGSKYKKLALDTYEPWFTFEKHFDLDKQVISHRHRSYAFDVPAADIDSMVCDSSGIPYLFVEYKYNNNYGKANNGGHNGFIANNMDLTTRSLSDGHKGALYNKAIADLGDGCQKKLPVIVVEYNLGHDIFSIYALNEHASKAVTLSDMTKEEYFRYIKEPENFR